MAAMMGRDLVAADPRAWSTGPPLHSSRFRPSRISAFPAPFIDGQNTLPVSGSPSAASGKWSRRRPASNEPLKILGVVRTGCIPIDGPAAATIVR